MAKTSTEKLSGNHVTDTDGRIHAVLTDGSGTLSQPSAAALADATANPTTTGQAAYVEGFNGTTWDRLRTAALDGGTLSKVLAVVPHIHEGGGTGDYQASVSIFGAGDANNGGRVPAQAGMAFVGGAAVYDRLRTPNVFKSFASTAITAGTGATVWTPTSGKKFRLMGYMISSSAAGVLIFGDNAVGTVIARSAAVAAAGIAQLGAGDMGNGILSAAANNVLKLDGPTGNVAGMVWGTEE